ncbi:MAG: 3-dehydroquinate synthase [Desulfomonile tiedjei]|uniref:Multifunctional fusion protein n=1 Tax=Desulfomonile tiedjei TaxID=2358 RepID=A0A9D6Z589_9BACT|nr:3-dehydroquinate synthase [Desulfomonile tiedjei]
MGGTRNIIITGFMGTGKTVVGKDLALLLGREFVDTDDLIEQRVGIPIATIFADMGEPRFRELENEVCRELARTRNLVVSTGGGMLLNTENRKLLTSSGIVIRLKCSPEKILGRVGKAGDRPLLNCADPAERIDALLIKREPAYSSLPFHVDTTSIGVVGTVETIVNILGGVDGTTEFISVASPGDGGYTIAVGPNLLNNVGQMLQGRRLSSCIAVVTDEIVAGLYLEPLMGSLRAAGFRVFPCVVPAGEESKKLSHVEQLYSQFLKHGLDRRGGVLALGGGVVGDLSGFAAATYMRGVQFVQCPTTLLAMVDSSVGGKTGVDLPHGKNLVGAFKQPILVVADTNCLKSLPQKEIRMGMAELIKHAIIDDAQMFEKLEQLGSPDLAPAQIARSVNVKVKAVEKDPFESGLREVLNLGHTVGHAVEKLSDYSLAHGDAVSIGLAAAARISHRMGFCGEHISQRIEKLLGQTGLPVRHDMEPDRLVEIMASDKKTIEGRIRFVLVKDLGDVLNGCEVPDPLVKDVLNKMRNSKA